MAIWLDYTGKQDNELINLDSIECIWLHNCEDTGGVGFTVYLIYDQTIFWVLDEHGEHQGTHIFEFETYTAAKSFYNGLKELVKPIKIDVKEYT